MDIVNEELGEDPSPVSLNRRIIGWDKVFRPISIDPADEGGAAAWLYRPPDEPSTEEQIMAAIREKNESLVPRFAGYPGIRRIENLFLYTTLKGRRIPWPMGQTGNVIFSATAKNRRCIGLGNCHRDHIG